jgi:hypothetical protein
VVLLSLRDLATSANQSLKKLIAAEDDSETAVPGSSQLS